MSSDNFETGRIKLIFFSDNPELRDTFFKSLCNKHGVAVRDEGYSWEEMFQEEVSHNKKYEPRYITLGNGVFEVVEYNSFDDHYHTIVKQEGVTEFSFSSSYHNGGACLVETLEAEFRQQGFFDELEKKQSSPPIVFGENYLD